MAFVRCYTGTDGQSHFEDLDLLPPEVERSIEQAATSITFTRAPDGRFSDSTDCEFSITPPRLAWAQE